jgi:hypothetical protein
LHPRLSIDQVCFHSAPIGEFIAHSRTVGVANIVLTSPQILAEGGLQTAKQALGGDGPRVEAINHVFGVFPDL